jgi:CheY-like chemotaxis protein
MSSTDPLEAPAGGRPASGQQPPAPERRGLFSTDRGPALLNAIVHELRNVIAPIGNAAQIVRMRGANDPNLLSIADIMERQIHDIGRVLNTVVDADLLMRGGLSVTRAPINLAVIVDDVLDKHRRLFEARAQRLHLSMPKREIMVDADGGRLLQVLAVLLENAAKHSPDASDIWLDVSIVSAEACIRVRDNGAGMSGKLLEQLFQPSKDPAAGQGLILGLSLPIAHELIRLHGGRMAASSAGPGKGSELAAFLPLCPRVAAPTEAVPRQATAPTTPPATAGRDHKRHILVADDNAALRESLCSLFRDMGHEVQAAADGAEAVKMARNWQPELVFLDINMPLINGFEVARQLRADFPAPAMTLVLMSGDTITDLTVQNAKQAGFDHCIDKINAFSFISGLLQSNG